MAYILQWHETRLNIQVDGDFDEEAIGMTARYLSDPRFHQIRHLFIDMEQVQDFSIPAEAVRELSQLQISEDHAQREISVVMLVKGLLGYGIARMWENFLDVSGDHNWDIYIAEERHAAESWLAGKALTP